MIMANTSQSLFLIVAYLIGIATTTPTKRYSPHFDSGRSVGTLSSSAIDEASGICASREHSNVIYTHNDSGGGNKIYAIDATSGHLRATITLDHASNHDWEDICCGPCPNGGNCIYIGDIGGNYHGHVNNIYKIKEPSSIKDQHISVHSGDKLHFSWDEQNAETLMVDPQANLYVVSKVSNGHHAKITRIPKSAWGSGHTYNANDNAAHTVHMTSPHNDPVGGDISPDGHEVLLKQQDHVLYYFVPDGNILKALDDRTAIDEPYRHERQGEAVCWDNHGSGYYTLSEGTHVDLNYYKRTSSKPSAQDLLG